MGPRGRVSMCTDRIAATAPERRAVFAQDVSVLEWTA